MERAVIPNALDQYVSNTDYLHCIERSVESEKPHARPLALPFCAHKHTHTRCILNSPSVMTKAVFSVLRRVAPFCSFTVARDFHARLAAAFLRCKLSEKTAPDQPSPSNPWPSAEEALASSSRLTRRSGERNPANTLGCIRPACSRVSCDGGKSPSGPLILSGIQGSSVTLYTPCLKSQVGWLAGSRVPLPLWKRYMHCAEKRMAFHVGAHRSS